MRYFATIAISLGFAAALCVAAPGASAQSKDPVFAVAGSYTYRTYCASCHGTKGRGDGPLAESLRFHPPDLTKIAQRNGGAYPEEMVFRIIDGRKPMAGHGGPDMPVWGDAFKSADTGYDEEQVKQKIQSLVNHLKTLQDT